MIILLFLLSFPVYAGFYADISIGIHDGEYDSFSQYDKKRRAVYKISPLIGTIETGYEFDNVSVFFRHDSSLKQTDTGLNMIGLKLRLTD